MQEYNLKDLNTKAKQAQETLNERRRELYKYARDKGFSSYEAIVLKDKDKETIDRLAAERDSKDAV